MPRKPVKLPDLDTLEGLARLGVTQQELADLCSCSQPTIAAKLARSPYKSVWNRGQAQMKLSIRRGLMKKAEDGDLGALIWLSKCVLRMQEPPREVHTEADLRSNTTIRWVAEWGRPEGEYLPPADGIELIEGEADEE